MHGGPLPDALCRGPWPDRSNSTKVWGLGGVGGGCLIRGSQLKQTTPDSPGENRGSMIPRTPRSDMRVLRGVRHPKSTPHIALSTLHCGFTNLMCNQNKHVKRKRRTHMCIYITHSHPNTQMENRTPHIVLRAYTVSWILEKKTTDLHTLQLVHPTS